VIAAGLLHGLERYTQARIGNIHAPETTSKFIAATFEHDTARPVECYAAPQLHTHAVVFNVTERENGQTRALQDSYARTHVFERSAVRDERVILENQCLIAGWGRLLTDRHAWSLTGAYKTESF
jgi:conjugative relaxase-like TrwC/TraI family protein